MHKVLKLIFWGIIAAIIAWGLVTPKGIRAAIANNIWSIEFLHSADVSPIIGDLNPFPSTHEHAGLLLAHQVLLQGQFDLAKAYLKPLVDNCDHLATDTYAEILYIQADYLSAFSLWEKNKDIQALVQAMAYQVTSKDPQLSTDAARSLYEIDKERFTNTYVDHLGREGKFDIAIEVLDRSIQEFPHSENLAHWDQLLERFHNNN